MVVLAVSLFGNLTAQKKEFNNIFFCFNNSMNMPNAPESFLAQAELVKNVGFEGMELNEGFDFDFAERQAILDAKGLKIPQLYWKMRLTDEGKVTYDEELREIIELSKDRDLVVSLIVLANQYKQNKEDGNRILSDAIGELADYAALYNVRIALYPHKFLYYEEIDHVIELVEMIDRKNVGAIFNVCHFLKVEGEEHIEEKLHKVMPYLFVVSINGADSGNTQEMGFDRLIQPLGEGTFDTYKVVKILLDGGYKGPIGLQCYNIKQDCELALYKSMSTWRKYKLRYLYTE